MYSIHVQGYHNGGRGSYETFRVAWSAVAHMPAEDLDFRLSSTRRLVEAGLAGVSYVRGAMQRDLAIDRATHRAVVAARRELSEIARMG